MKDKVESYTWSRKRREWKIGSQPEPATSKSDFRIKQAIGESLVKKGLSPNILLFTVMALHRKTKVSQVVVLQKRHLCVQMRYRYGNFFHAGNLHKYTYSIKNL